MGLQGRTTPLRLWGPRGAARVLKRAESVGVARLGYPVEVTELAPGEVVQRPGYRIAPYPVEHRGATAVGWVLAEEERLGRFNPELARELGIPEGPLWGQLHRGITVTLPDGRTVDPATLVGQPRPGRTVVYTGDTRPCAATVEAARGADVLVHEATFADEEAARAAETGHSTAREAATVAAEAGVGRLVLTHLSARYSRDPGDLDREAKSRFAATTVAKDGTEIEVRLREA
jgi:ribonuclease Z